MANLNSKSEFFEGSQTYYYNTHYKFPKIRYNKKRRARAYQGIVNLQEPESKDKQLKLF